MTETTASSSLSIASTQSPEMSDSSESSKTNATAATIIRVEAATRNIENDIITTADGNLPAHEPMSLETTDVGESSTSEEEDSSSPTTALQSLVLAATSDLLESSPTSMDVSILDTPTSQVAIPHKKASSVIVAAADTTEKDTKPKTTKGILRKPRYLPTTTQTPGGKSTTVSATANNTIHNINQSRKYRKHDFDFSEIDDDDVANRDANNSMLMSILWFLIVLPVIVLSYGGLPYIVMASLVWSLLFVARWLRRFLVDEFSMRRNSVGNNSSSSSSLNAVARRGQKVPTPPAVENAFDEKKSDSSTTTSNGTNIVGSILAGISTIDSTRSTKVHFEKGMKFPERKLLRQPIPRLFKPRPPPNPPPGIVDRPHQGTPSKTRPSLFYNEGDTGIQHSEGDTCSLDSLMVLRNYMKDHTKKTSSKTSNNKKTSIEPTSVSVMAPPDVDEEDEDASISILSPEKFQSSCESGLEKSHQEIGWDSQELNNKSVSAFTSFQDETDDQVVSSSRRPRDSLMTFPQALVEEEDTAYESRYGHTYSESVTIEMEEDSDKQDAIDGFYEGLFGIDDDEQTPHSHSLSSVTKLREKASRYRRRKPRDSLCFATLTNKNNAKKTMECPSIPACPSDELESLQKTIQEKFEQAVVIEHVEPSNKQDINQQSSSDQETAILDTSEERDDIEDEPCNESVESNTLPLATGSWDEDINIDNENSQQSGVGNGSDDSVDGSSLLTAASDKCDKDETIACVDSSEGESDPIQNYDEPYLVSDDEGEQDKVSLNDEKTESVPQLLELGEDSLSGGNEDTMLLATTTEESDSFDGVTSTMDDLAIVNDLQVPVENSKAALDKNTVPATQDFLSYRESSSIGTNDAEVTASESIHSNETFVFRSTSTESESIHSNETFTFGAKIIENDSYDRILESRNSESTDIGVNRNESSISSKTGESLTNEGSIPLPSEHVQSAKDLPQLMDPEVISLDKEVVANEEHVVSADHEVSQLDEYINENCTPFVNYEAPHISELDMSFDGSDDVECILSPNGLEMAEDDMMFLDRDPMMNTTFKNNGKININKIKAGSPEDHVLQIKQVVSHEDVECILSPSTQVEGNNTASSHNETVKCIESSDTASTHIEVEDIAPSPPESPMSNGDKENLDDDDQLPYNISKDLVFVDTSNTDSPLSPRFKHSLLNPTSPPPFQRSVLSPTIAN